MNNPAVFAFGIELLLKSMVVCVVALAAAGMMRRASAALRCWIWNAVFLGLLALPMMCAIVPSWQVMLPSLLPAPPAPPAAVLAPSSPMPVAPPLPVIAPVAPEMPAPPTAVPEMAAPVSAPDAEMPPPAAVTETVPPAPAIAPVPKTAAVTEFDPASIVFCVYLVGMSLALLRVFSGWLRLRRLERFAVPCADARIDDAAHDAARTLNVLRRRTLLFAAPQTPAAIPMTWGHFRPRLLLPADAPQWDAAHLNAVLLHEFAHVSRADWLMQQIAAFVCALYWWNPLVWKIARLRRLDSERACDDLVILSGVPSAEYASVLLNTARARRPRFSAEGAISMAQPAHLSARVQCLLDRHQSRRAPARLVLCFGAAFGLAVLLAISALRPAEAEPPAAAPEIAVSEMPAPTVAPAAIALPAEELPTPSAPALAPVTAEPLQTPNAPALASPALATTLATPQLSAPPKTVPSDGIAWGSVQDGLQTALRLVGSNSTYRIEDEMRVELLMRNVSAKPRRIQLVMAPAYYINGVGMRRTIEPETLIDGKITLRGREGVKYHEITLPPNTPTVLPVVFEPLRLHNWKTTRNWSVKRNASGKYEITPKAPSDSKQEDDRFLPGSYTLEWDGRLQFRNPGQVGKQLVAQPLPLPLTLLEAPKLMMQTPLFGEEPAIAWGENINGIQAGLLQPYLSDPGFADGKPKWNYTRIRNGRLVLFAQQAFDTVIYFRNTSTVPVTFFTAFKKELFASTCRIRLSHVIPATAGDGIMSTETQDTPGAAFPMRLKPGEVVAFAPVHFEVAKYRSNAFGLQRDVKGFSFALRSGGSSPIEYKLSVEPRIRFDKKGKEILLASGKLSLLDPGIVKGSVRIEGMVVKPGTYPFDSTMTLRQLLAQAGGVTFMGSLTVHFKRERKPEDSNPNRLSRSWGMMSMRLNDFSDMPLERISEDAGELDVITVDDKPLAAPVLEPERKIPYRDNPAPAPTATPAETALAALLESGKWDNADVEKAKRLLRQGASIRTRSLRGVTVLMMAAKSGDLSLMRAALRGGVDAKARTTEGFTALDFVMSSRNVDKLRLLLDAGADPNAATNGGRTPLMLATNFKFRDGINLLLSRGANINARNAKGYTALAYTDGHAGIIRVLRDKGIRD